MFIRMESDERIKHSDMRITHRSPAYIGKNLRTLNKWKEQRAFASLHSSPSQRWRCSQFG